MRPDPDEKDTLQSAAVHFTSKPPTRSPIQRPRTPKPGRHTLSIHKSYAIQIPAVPLTPRHSPRAIVRLKEPLWNLPADDRSPSPTFLRDEQLSKLSFGHDSPRCFAGIAIAFCEQRAVVSALGNARFSERFGSNFRSGAASSAAHNSGDATCV